MWLRAQPSLPERYRALIARHAPGRTFADIGCMWNIHGAYAFHALDVGATHVTGVDLMPPTPQFLAENHARGDRVRFLQGDVNEPATVEAVGPVSTVFCSGVLYHVPNPLETLRRLRHMCQETLILVSATIPEQRRPQTAIFLPYLDERSRHAVRFGSALKIGLHTPYDPAESYANWFWGFAPSCVEAMTRAADFEITERYPHRHAICLVCRPR
jgi:hypothetical protein